MENKIIKEINLALKEINNSSKKKKNQTNTKHHRKLNKVSNGDTVTVHYKGTLKDGTEFDNSWSKNKPFTFKVGNNEVIKGWDIIIKKMRVGDKINIEIPYHLAYGAKSIGNIIPPYSNLFFEIKLLKINK
jgi:FKBP-type peptidyl-prolyl cis-trans isomerase